MATTVSVRSGGHPATGAHRPKLLVRVARQTDECTTCGGTIDAGDRVQLITDGIYVHEDCMAHLDEIAFRDPQEFPDADDFYRFWQEIGECGS